MELDIPTYIGSLGMLAWRHVTFRCRPRCPGRWPTLVDMKGYFRQRLDERGQSYEDADPWRPVREKAELQLWLGLSSGSSARGR